MMELKMIKLRRKLIELSKNFILIIIKIQKNQINSSNNKVVIYLSKVQSILKPGFYNNHIFYFNIKTTKLFKIPILRKI